MRLPIFPVLAFLLALTSCGGGEDQRISAEGPQRKPQATAATQSAATSDADISQSEQARQLLAFAEQSYPALFPGPAETAWHTPFAYRFYPGTGVYLGVALQDDLQFEKGRVYAMGGSFGATPIPLAAASDYVQPKSRLQTLELPHQDLVGDASRGLFYASLPAAPGEAEGRIATINALTGQVSLSRPIGAQPEAMALSADGAWLYVALEGSGEVLQLNLPGLEERARLRLPTSWHPKGLQPLVGRIAASPTEPDTFAITLKEPSDINFRAIVLVRQMAPQPVRETYTSAKQLSFTPDGTELFGNGGFSLERIRVQPNGVVRIDEDRVDTATGNFLRSLGTSGDWLVTGNRVWNRHDLRLRGTADVRAECLPKDSSLLFCWKHGPEGQLFTVEMAAMTVRERIAIPATSIRAELVLGAGDTAALRAGFTSAFLPRAERIHLLRDEMLRPQAGRGPLPALAKPVVSELANGQTAVELATQGVAVDTARGLYYLSIPSGVVHFGNRIAALDAKGNLQFSQPIGSDPGPLAVDADGKSLYVGLTGSGELLRLSLPDLKVVQRLRLPITEFGATRYAFEIVASPTQGGLLIVLTGTVDERGFTGMNSMVLVRDMQVRSRASDIRSTQALFLPDGLRFISLQTSSQGATLGRFRVSGDAIQRTGSDVATAIGYYWHGFDLIGQDQLVAGHQIWKSADLSPSGRLSDEAECLARRADKLICLSGYGSSVPGVFAVGLPGLQVLGQQPIPAGSGGKSRMTLGPAGTALLRLDFSESDAFNRASRLILMRGELLQ